MDYLIGVLFTGQTKVQYFLTNYEIEKGEYVICESPRGLELGKVTTEKKEYEVKVDEEIPFNYIIRIATQEDLLLHQQNVIDAVSVIKTVQKESNDLNLGMKVTNAEFTLDRLKLTISYLADDRVDFRDLLKILASIYHCRIELRQIGPRDKAKMIGGIGICGLPLCCSTFLNEFDGISITMAKNQMLALNIPKLSGHCGKLICCLKYEDETYTLEKQNLPRVGLRVKIEDVIYRIVSINIITKMVRLESSETTITLPLSQIEDKILHNFDANAYNQQNQIEQNKNKKFNKFKHKGQNNNEKN